MDKVMHNSPETQAIRQRMEEVRCELDEDVQEIVEGARDLGDWRSYVRSYPWVCLGAAFAVGYFIVPRRPSGIQPDAKTTAALAKQSRPLAPSFLGPPGSMRGMLLGFVGNLALRGITSYVEQQAGKLFAAPPTKPLQDDQP